MNVLVYLLIFTVGTSAGSVLGYFVTHRFFPHLVVKSYASLDARLKLLSDEKDRQVDELGRFGAALTAVYRYAEAVDDANGGNGHRLYRDRMQAAKARAGDSSCD